MSERPQASSDATPDSSASSSAPLDPAQAALDRAAERDKKAKETAKTKGRRKLKLWAGVSAVVVIAAGVGYATLPLWQDQLSQSLHGAVNGTPPKTTTPNFAAPKAGQAADDVAALRDALGGMQTKLHALEQRVEGLEKKHAALHGGAQSGAPLTPPAAGAIAVTPNGPVASADAAPTTSPALEQRLAALERSMTAALDEQLGGLEKEVAELKANRAQASSVLALADRIAAVEGAVQHALSRQDQALAFLLAVGQLRAAIDEGRPFGDELKTAKAVAPASIDVATLMSGFEGVASEGVPTTVQLQQSFASLGAQVIRASALPDATADWWTRTVDRVLSLVTIRRTDGEAVGTTPAAIVSRAEALMKSGALNGAIAELSALTGAPAEVAQPWLNQAKARLAATMALSELTGEALAAVTATATTPPLQAPMSAPAPASGKEG